MKKEKIKNQLWYFWSFYKWIIVAVAIAAALVLYFVAAKLTEKENVLSVMLMDCHTQVSDEQMNSDFGGYMGLDQKKYGINIQNSLMISDGESGNYTMSCLAKFLAEVGNAGLDACGMLESDFANYDQADTWMALEECFTLEELEKLSAYVYRGKDGEAVGLYADGLPVLAQYGCYESGDSRAVVGIIYNTQHKDTAVSYLKYLAGM